MGNPYADLGGTAGQHARIIISSHDHFLEYHSGTRAAPPSPQHLALLETEEVTHSTMVDEKSSAPKEQIFPRGLGH